MNSRQKPSCANWILGLVLLGFCAFLVFVTQTWLALLLMAICLTFGWLLLVFHPYFEFGVWQTWTAAIAFLLVVTGSILIAFFKTRHDRTKPADNTAPNRHLVRLTRVVWLATVAIAGVGVMFHGAGPMMRLWIRPMPRGNSAYRTWSRGHLKQISLGMHQYAEHHREKLPPGGTYSSGGIALHGWPARLLPYIDEQPVVDRID